jgi:hypothetical protein
VEGAKSLWKPIKELRGGGYKRVAFYENAKMRWK